MKNGAISNHLNTRVGDRPTRTGGFTLIELMIVVVIIGILAAIAYPSYEKSVAKSRRSDAEAALQGFANAMERHYTETGRYTAAASGGGDTGAPASTIYPKQAPLDGTTKYYDLSIQAAGATTYTLAATPIATSAQANDRCGTLTLDNTGTESAAAGQSDCWSK